MVQLLAATQLRARAAAAPARRARAAAVSSRTPVLRVVAFKDGSEQQQQQPAEGAQAARAKITFQLPMHVEFGQELAVVGAVDALGAWDVKQSLPMAWNEGDVWSAQAEVPAGTNVEYKYIIVVPGEEKEVLEWQPCNNLELQAEAAGAAGTTAELTVRDAWAGELHEVLPGTLPLPAPAAAPEPEQEPVAAGDEAAVAAAPAAVAADEPAAAPTHVELPSVVAAEDLGAAELGEEEETETEAPAVAAVVAPVAPPPAPAAAKPAAPAKPAGERRRTTTSNGAKPAGGNGSRAGKVVAAAAAAAPPAVDAPPKAQAKPEAKAAVRYGSLTTAELKEVCKQRGLSAKGQRKDLLSRLQKLLQQGPQA